MGGRRSYSLGRVIRDNPNVEAKKATLRKSFQKEDFSGITVGVASLVPDINNLAKILIYSGKLLSTIKNKYEPDELKVLREVYKKVRLEWVKKKEKEKIETNTVLDTGVIDAVSRALKEINK